MALIAHALMSLVEAKDHLKVTGAADDALIEHHINRVSEAVDAYCRRRLKKTTYTNLRLIGPPGPKLHLRAVPIDVSLTLTVSVGGAAQTAWKSEADGDPALKDVIVGTEDYYNPISVNNHLWRAGGWGTPSYAAPYNVLLSYTGGFSAVPDDLKSACLYILHRTWRDHTSALTDVVTVTGPQGSVTILDNELPQWAVLVLQRYRYDRDLMAPPAIPTTA